ncbi:hypothetical protein [Terriglobus albidus]|uniref:hypothetical protein n=1 Tax=Terriglobus albidus TaxID=1592106 RepID=UPI0021DFAC51|nr:hypothetical protein [Terriglobus albidus]
MKFLFAVSVALLLAGQAKERREIDLTKPVVGHSSLGVPGGTMGSSTPSTDYKLPFEVINKSCRVQAGGDAIVELSLVNHSDRAYGFPISVDQRTTHRVGTHNRRMMDVEARFVDPKGEIRSSRGIIALYSSAEELNSATEIGAGEEIDLRLRLNNASSLLSDGNGVRITFGETQLKDASFYIARRSQTVQSTTAACPISG